MMTLRCQKCGAEIGEDWPVCRNCFEPVKSPGFFSRLLRSFGRPRVDAGKPTASAGGPRVNIHISERIKIKDAKTGDVREYHSLEEVPPEYRERIRQAREAALAGRSAGSIHVTDVSGQMHSYNSAAELPTELRAWYEKARHSDS